MLKNYFVTAVNNLWHNKLFSAINIVGLSTALVGVVFIALYVLDELSYDRWLPDGERIVRLHTAYTEPFFQTVRSAGRMRAALSGIAATQVENSVRLVPYYLRFNLNEKPISERVTFADGSFFDVLQLPLMEGNAGTVFDKPMSLVLSKNMALKYFGDVSVVGETLTVCCLGDSPLDLQITGVLDDFPEQSHLEINFLIRMQPNLFDFDDSVLNTWTSVNLYTYFKLTSPSAIVPFQQRINEWLSDDNNAMGKSLRGELPNGLRIQDVVKLKLMKLTDIHLHAIEDAGTLGDFRPLGNVQTVLIFSMGALLLLAIAVFNFVNLTTAHASHRAKEVAMRKVMGARRLQLSTQFVGESITVTFIALFLALVLVELLLPAFNSVFGFQFDLDLMADRVFIACLFTVVMLVGILAGAYPALYMSRFKPASNLKSGRSQQGDGQERLRSLLVVFQFIVFIVLGISTVGIFAQTYFVRHFDVGYRYDNKLVLYGIMANGIRNRLTTFMEEINTIPAVDSIVLSNDVPSRDNENNTPVKLLGAANEEPREPVLSYYSVSEGYFDAYEMTIVAGRDFASFPDSNLSKDPDGRRRPVIVNESALKPLGISSAENALGRTVVVFNGIELEIIGVVKDIYYNSLKFEVKPSVFFNSAQLYRVATISYTTNDLPALIEEIESRWVDFAPEAPFNISPLAAMISNQYQPEDQQVKMLGVFSLLSIFVACLGLYGLSSFTMERKKREIALRKLHGGRVRHILSLLLKKFSFPVLVANLLGWPLAVWGVTRWLENFTNRLDMGWLLIISLSVTFVSFLLMWTTIVTNTYRTIRQRPVEALRYE